MAVLHQCRNGSVAGLAGYLYIIMNVSNGKEPWIARRKHQHLKTAGKDHQSGKRDGVPQKEKRDRGTERERQMEGGFSAL